MKVQQYKHSQNQHNMTNTELLEKLQQDLRKLNTNYETHAMIERIIQAYKAEVSKDVENS